MNHTEQKIKELEELANEFNNKLKDLREEAKREEFKVEEGEWIMCIKDLVMTCGGNIEATKGVLYDVTNVFDGGFCFRNNSGNDNHRIYSNNKWFRKATNAELAILSKNKTPKITINGNLVRFYSDHIQVGCTRVELKTINQIANHYQK
jgi:hypothetical protein